MSNNYEWQKYQANGRVQARFQEAETHRQMKLAGDKRPFLPTLKIIMVGVGALVAIWLLVGCTAPVVEAYPNSEVAGLTLAEKIHFQDQNEAGWQLSK